jgi:energy-coupling factor transporter ATP-binding protein EcfA2
MNNPNRIFTLRQTPIEYTMDQKKALLLIMNFVASEDLFFLIIGNAGTGKTTIAENIANYTGAYMIAPTNAAVNRLKDKFGYVGDDRFATIHQTLYTHPDPVTGKFEAAKGLRRKNTYIVDEASMIDSAVLDDLIRSAQSKLTKLIFIGDDFQLEPIGKDPKIFNWEKSNENFLDYWKIKLNEVKRNDGCILKIATHLRECKYPELANPNNDEFSIVSDFTKNLAEDIKENQNYIVLVSTNDNRLKYNQRIRKFRFKKESENVIVNAEKLISVSNAAKVNGELFEVFDPMIIKSFHEIINVGTKTSPSYKSYSMHLIQYKLSANSMYTRQTLLIPELDLPSLHSSQLLTSDSIKYDKLLTETNPYNKMKKWRGEISISTYGYATSVHKSQGNEWDNVYIDCGWLSNNWNKCRWLYTAITRAKKKVEIINSSQFKIINYGKLV